MAELRLSLKAIHKVRGASTITSRQESKFQICSLLRPPNPLSASSDQHQISPHHISAFQHIQVMRIKEMTTKDELS